MLGASAGSLFEHAEKHAAEAAFEVLGQVLAVI